MGPGKQEAWKPYLLPLCRIQATSEVRAVPNLQIGKPRDTKSLSQVTPNKDSTHCLLPGAWTSHPVDSTSCGPCGLDSRSLGPQTRPAVLGDSWPASSQRAS